MKKRVFVSFILSIFMVLFGGVACTPDELPPEFPDGLGGLSGRVITFYLDDYTTIVATVDFSLLTPEYLDSIQVPPDKVGYRLDGFRAEDNTVVDRFNIVSWLTERSYINRVIMELIPIEYNITWDFGVYDEVPLASTYNVEDTYYIPTLYKEGYTFLGWYTPDNPDNFNTNLVLGNGMTGDVTYCAAYNPIDDIDYKIVSYFEKFEIDDEYEIRTEEAETVLGTGYFDELIVAHPQDFDNYEFMEDLSITQGSISLNPKLELKLYYKFKRVDIHFDYDNGTPVEDFVVKKGLRCQEYTAYPAKTGYEFSHWESSDGTRLDSQQMRYYNHHSEDTFTAIYTPASGVAYTVKTYRQLTDESYTIDSTTTQYGTTGTSVTLSDEIIGDLLPISTGNWYFDEDMSTITGTILADGSLVLSVYYTLHRYSVAFDLDGGVLKNGETFDLTLEGVIYGDTVTPPSSDIFEKAGYSFVGWENSDGQALDIANSSHWTVTKVEVYTAVWEETTVSYTINYWIQSLDEDDNPIYRAEDMETKTVSTYKTGDTITEDLDITTGAFEYQTSVDATLSKANSPEVVKLNYYDGLKFVLQPTGNVFNIYYKLKTCYIRFNYNIEGVSIQQVQFYYGARIIYPEDPEKDYYTFDKWKWGSSTPTLALANYQINAYWIENKYTIDYVLPEGLSNPEGNKTEFTVATTGSISAISKLGYDFSGWSIGDSIDKSLTISYSDLLPADPKVTEYTVTLTAHIDVIVYTITYGGLDGAEAINPTTYTVEDRVVLNRPTKSDFVFMGWQYSTLPLNRDYIIEKGSIGHMTITAVWETYTIYDVVIKDTYTFGVDNFIKIEDKDSISLDYFEATCFDNEGTELAVNIEKLYLDEDWSNRSKLQVKFTASNKNVTKENILDFYVVSKPEVAFNKTEFKLVDLKYARPLNTFLDYSVSGGYSTSATAIFVSKVDSSSYTVPSVGGVYTLRVVVEDTVELYEDAVAEVDVAVFDVTGFRYEYDTTVTECIRGQELETLKFKAWDSAGVELTSVYLQEPDSTPGTTDTCTFYLNDKYHNHLRVDVPNIKIYATPIVTYIGNNYIFDDEDYKTMFEAYDSFGVALDMKFEIDKEYKFGNNITITCSATDHMGLSKSASITKCVSKGDFGCMYSKVGDDDIMMIKVVEYVGSDVDIVIPDGIQYISEDIFKTHAPNVKSIVVPNSVQYIHYKAFNNCTNVEELSIPFIGLVADCSGFSNQYVQDGTNETTTDSLFGVSATTNVKKLTITKYFKAFHRRSLSVGRKMKDTLEELVIDVANADDFDITLISNNQFTTNNTALKKIVLPDFVHELPILYGCSALSSINVSNVVGDVIVDNCPLLNIDSFTFGGEVADFATNTFKITNCPLFTSITIPANLSRVLDNAFINNVNLETVTFASGIDKTIGATAFSGCTKLSNVTIGDSVTSIGTSAFEGLTALNKVEILSNKVAILDRAFYGSSIVTLTFVTGTTTSTIGLSAFEGCNSLRDVTINATSIGERGFYGCATLGTVTLNVVSIGKNAFRDCTTLTTATFGDIVTTIGESAFENCTSLSTATLPSSITTIGNFAFQYTAVTHIHIPSNYATLGGNYIYRTCTMVESITIAEDITAVTTEMVDTIFATTSPEAIIYIHKYVTSISIKDSYNVYNVVFAEDSTMTELTPSAFSNARELRSVVLPDTLEVIGGGAFYNATKLESINIPTNLKTIGNNAFENCEMLGNITLPSTLKTIGYSAFKGCSKIDIFEVPATIENIGSQFISGTLVTEFTIPSTITDICDRMFSSTSITSIHVHSGILAIGDKAFEDCTSLATITFEDGVTSIGDEAFSGCISLNNVVIPSTVGSIGNYAFKNCTTLSSITLNINNTVEISLNFTFCGCTSLSSIVIPSNVKSMMAPFTGCTGLREIEFKGAVSIDGLSYYHSDTYKQKLTLDKVKVVDVVSWLGMIFTDIDSNPTSHGADLYIGDSLYELDLTGVTSLPDYVFANFGIENIIIPETVSSIGEGVFYNCTNLKTAIVNANVPSIALMFMNCTALESVTLNDNITDIRSAFKGCSSLTTVNIPSNVTVEGTAHAFEGCSSLSSITIPSPIAELGEYMFADCSSLSDITFPETITTFNAYSLKNTGFSEFIYPSTVTTTNIGALSGCKNLASIFIPKTLTSLGSETYKDCTSLSSVEFELGISRSITSYMFYGCTSLVDFTIPSNVTTINSYAFSYTGIAHIDTNNVNNIGDYAFAYSNISSIDMADTVTNLGNYAFESCLNLTDPTKVNLTGSLKYYPEGLFARSGLTDIVGIKNAQYVFNYHQYEGCLNLVNITIPYGANVTTIFTYSTWLFKDCVNLKSITIAEGYTDINISLDIGKLFEDSEEYIELDYLIFPKSLTILPRITANAFSFADECCVNNIVFPSEMVVTTTAWESIDIDAIVYKNELRIPEGITTISGSAFRDQNQLRKIYIPSTVTSIGKYAFDGCTAEIVWVSPTITTIGDYAFNGYDYHTFTMPDTVTSVGTRGILSSSITTVYITSEDLWSRINFADKYGNPLYHGARLYKLVGEDRVLVDYVNLNFIISGETKIGDYAYCGYISLEYVYLDTSTVTIGIDGFKECSNLRTIVVETGICLSTILEGADTFSGSQVRYIISKTTSEDIANYSTHLFYMGVDMDVAHVYYHSDTEPVESGHYWHYVSGDEGLVFAVWGTDERP